MSRSTADAFLALSEFTIRGRNKLFSLLARGAFASFGSHSVLQLPLRLKGHARIAIGDNVFVGAGSWLQVLEGEAEEVAITIGDGTSIVGDCVLSAVSSIHLGSSVLLARNVYIADHTHEFADPRTPVLAQGIARIGRVEIGDGAWLGQNVVVGPGVSIGAGAVIGANSVVLADVPDGRVAVGSPARVLEQERPPRSPERG